ncbi:DUF2306 domain-containing protein [Leucothrix arctica]|uniref:DUF2306 domain-containing protein n=1 Tax=Leucothrix arctica TaxID=1481894 RepID=A0A317CLY2_9GAMM|nr:DUF2306 domain-containing protein [Leucothrix arctica]PWQ99544.1 hypothetical protein DKT75_00295 [Leucothrix arctica]
MNFDALFSSPLAIQMHVFAAVSAAIIGLVVLWRRKGTATHKRWGKVWVVLMLVTSLTSFFIHEIKLVGIFSPIHIISVLVLITLYRGVGQARVGQINDHKRSMKSTYIGGIGVAGTLSFFPGRLMHRVTIEPTYERIFGEMDKIDLLASPWLSPAVLAIVLIAGFVIQRLLSK